MLVLDVRIHLQSQGVVIVLNVWKQELLFKYSNMTGVRHLEDVSEYIEAVCKYVY